MALTPLGSRACDVASGVMSHVAVRPRMREVVACGSSIRMHLGAGAGKSIQRRARELRLHSERKNVTQIARALKISRENVYRIEREMAAA